jgi:cell division protease FtsH
MNTRLRICSSIKLPRFNNSNKRNAVLRTRMRVQPVFIVPSPARPVEIDHAQAQESNTPRVTFASFSAPSVYLKDVENDNSWEFNTLSKAIDDNRISNVIVDSLNHTVLVNANDGHKHSVQVPVGMTTDDLTKLFKDHNITYDMTNNTQTVNTQINQNIVNPAMLQFVLANFIVPLMMFFFMLSMLGRFMKSKGGFSSFGKHQAKFQEVPDTGITFDDVAGCTSAKRDMQELVDFLQNPEKYKKLGAKIPKGCLLIGPPGTGKGLLARALAGEAKVPFFSCSASEFVEIFVGNGASKVRSLWENARKHAPCIIFIDEIDAVGKARGATSMPGNDEREQTINQLLSEMDGFDGDQGIIVLAATNRPDVLDPALMRPGRFDRKIMVERPDFTGRVAILKVHTKTKPLDADVNLESLARVTAGCSGADLANLANEAAILASRKDKESISMSDFEEALDHISMGPEKTSMIISDRQKRILAAHEAGHALIALKIGEFDKLKKVTIIPRGSAGGLTMFEPDQERVDMGLYSREYLENQLCVALGGRVAEELTFGAQQVTTGASSDLVMVMKIARRMVTDFGFSQKLGTVAWKGGSVFSENSDGYSQQTAYDIDNEIKKLVDKAFERTFKLLKNEKTHLDMLSNELLKVETMSGDEVKKLLDIQ